jgi:hypothetical protein
MTATLSAAHAASDLSVYRSISVEIKGLDAMLLHNGALASPLQSVTKAIKSLNAKKTKKTERDIEMIAQLEVIGGLYLARLDENGDPDGLVSPQIELGENNFNFGYINPEEPDGALLPFQGNQIVMPGINLEALLVKGAKRSRWGTDFKTAVMVPNDYRIRHNLEHLPLAKLIDTPDFVDSRLVIVQRNRVTRTRPRLARWSIAFDINYMPSVVNASQIEKALEDCSLYVGVGDYTPRFGKFTVTKFQAND